MATQIFLVRHGETAWSITGQHTGSTDLPLTGRGEQEAKGLEQRLNAIVFSRVFTSPQQRAQQSCRLAGLGAGAEILADLAEWNYGDYEGKCSAAIRCGRPEWELFQDGCPNGELPIQVSARADRVIARLRLIEGNVALFTHGDFGRALAARWIGLSIGEGWHFLLGTTSLSILGYEHDRLNRPAIVLWNSVPTDIPRTTGSSGCGSAAARVSRLGLRHI